MRLFALLSAALFMVSAVIQLNDPDPVRWIAIYSAAAALALLRVFLRPPAWLCSITGLTALVWALTLLPGIIRVAAYTANEEERELIGLLLVCVSMLVIAANGSFTKQRPSDAPHQ